MRSTKKFNVHLYKLVTGQGSSPLEETLEHLSSLALKDRIKPINGKDIRLEHVALVKKSSESFWELDFSILRFDNGPGRASKDTPVTDFDLADGEGFGEETSALYDSKSGYFVLQYNHFGARAAMIAAYLSAATGNPNDYDLQLSLNDEAVARLSSKKTFSKIEIRVALNKLSDAYRKNNVSLCSALQAQQQEFGGDVVTVVVGIEPHSNGSLQLKNKLKSIIGLAAEPEAVTSLKVWGKDDNETSVDLVDLLEEARRIVFTDLQLSAGLRYPLDERLTRLYRAYNGWKTKVIP